MNQYLKETVYGKGTDEQVAYMAKLGGMNKEETQVFQLIHLGQTDLDIQEAKNLSRKAYERIEESVRAKLLIAVFHCINFTMDKNRTF